MYQHGICTLMLAEVVGMTDGNWRNGEIKAGTGGDFARPAF